eukprot:3886287-Pleurochrysis_carterae.AAC.3
MNAVAGLGRYKFRRGRRQCWDLRPARRVRRHERCGAAALALRGSADSTHPAAGPATSASGPRYHRHCFSRKLWWHSPSRDVLCYLHQKLPDCESLLVIGLLELSSSLP